jgi:hypothetical protein
MGETVFPLLQCAGAIFGHLSGVRHKKNDFRIKINGYMSTNYTNLHELT